MAKVTVVQGQGGGGKIEIEYFSEEELIRLCDLIGGRNRLAGPGFTELNDDS